MRNTPIRLFDICREQAIVNGISQLSQGPRDLFCESFLVTDFVQELIAIDEYSVLSTKA